MIYGVRAFLVLAILSIPMIAGATANPFPYCALSTPPGAITAGNPARLIWFTENAVRASIAGIGNVSLQNGYVDVYPRQNTTYTMTVSNAVYARTCSVIVTVIQPTSFAFYQTPYYVSAPTSWLATMVPVTKTYTTQNSSYGYGGGGYGNSYWDERNSYYGDSYGYGGGDYGTYGGGSFGDYGYGGGSYGYVDANNTPYTSGISPYIGTNSDMHYGPSAAMPVDSIEVPALTAPIVSQQEEKDPWVDPSPDVFPDFWPPKTVFDINYETTPNQDYLQSAVYQGSDTNYSGPGSYNNTQDQLEI